MSINKSNIILLILLLSCFGYFLIKLLSVDNNNYMPTERQENVIDTFNLHSKIECIEQDSLLYKFPYQLYVSNANINNIEIVKRDLSILDTIFSTKTTNRHVISKALTEKLENKISFRHKNYNPDSLIILFQWVEKFKYYSEIDVENRLLFNSIHNYWVSYIGNLLTQYSNNNPNVKYDFKFRFLVAKCSEKNFNVSLKVSPIDKVIYNLLSNNWSHLIEASWLQASIIQKIVFFVFIMLTILSYIIFIKQSLNYYNKKK